MNINNKMWLQTIYNCYYKLIYLLVIVCFATSWPPSIHVRLVGGTSNMIKIHFGCYLIFVLLKIELWYSSNVLSDFRAGTMFWTIIYASNLNCKYYLLPYRYEYIIITVWFAIIT